MKVFASIFALVTLFVLVGLLLPQVGSQTPSKRMMCSNKMRQINLALLNYQADYGALPPAYTEDANGKPMHSWRTLILPFIEEQKLLQHQ